jgi:hypothetical protein
MVAALSEVSRQATTQRRHLASVRPPFAEAAPGERQPYFKPQSLTDDDWTEHTALLSRTRHEHGFPDPQLHTALTLHRYGLSTPSARGMEPMPDGTPRMHTFEHLEAVGLIRENGALTSTGWRTLYLLEHPKRSHMTRHEVSDVLQAHITARLGSPQLNL